MNPVQKLRALKLKWRLMHPVEGIIKPLIREFWRQTKEVAVNLAWVGVHVYRLIRDVSDIGLSWPSLLILMAFGLLGVIPEVILGLGFWKLYLILLAVEGLRELSIKVSKTWKEKSYA